MSIAAEPKWLEVAPGVRMLQGAINAPEAIELMEDRRKEAARRLRLPRHTLIRPTRKSAPATSIDKKS
ncbi:hypothetical protein AB0P28_15370 [Pseudarthrobacter sp. NPDC089323]|uniref:hypothetical protein n=1 Tax=Arthrobacter sp. SD76 TaxID=3415007 RepID=UPI00347582A2